MRRVWEQGSDGGGLDELGMRVLLWPCSKGGLGRHNCFDERVGWRIPGPQNGVGPEIPDSNLGNEDLSDEP